MTSGTGAVASRLACQCVPDDHARVGYAPHAMRRTIPLRSWLATLCAIGCGDPDPATSEPACANALTYAIDLRIEGLAPFAGRTLYVMTSVPEPRCRADRDVSIDGDVIATTIENGFVPERAVYPDVAAYIDVDDDGTCDPEVAWRTVTTGFPDRATPIALRGADFDGQRADACERFFGAR